MEADKENIQTFTAMFEGFALAVQRFEAAIKERDATQTFAPLFELLNWAVALDDRACKRWCPEGEPLGWGWRDRIRGAKIMRGVQYVRNGIHHQWSDALERDDGARGYPRTHPVVYFEWRWRDAKELPLPIEIHSALAGQTPGKKHGVEVLNKSGIVLMCAVWEAYCEDIAAEAVDHLIANAADAFALPKTLRKNIARELKNDLDESAVWKLADDGWKKHLSTRTKAMTEERNRKLNTPKTSNIKDLFDTAIGLPDVPSAWYWSGIWCWRRWSGPLRPWSDAQSAGCAAKARGADDAWSLGRLAFGEPGGLVAHLQSLSGCAGAWAE